MSSLRWKERDLCSFRPCAKGGHTTQCLRHDNVTVTSERTLLTFGGSDAYGVCYNDVVALEVPSVQESNRTSWRCTELQATHSSHGPGARMSHTAVTVPSAALTTVTKPSEDDGDFSVEAMVVFGGSQQVPEPEVFDDCFALRVHKRWTELLGTWKAPPLLQWKKIETIGGQRPSARHSHVSVVTSDRSDKDLTLWIYGGSDNQSPLGSCHALSLRSGLWREVTLPGHFVPREMSAAAVLTSNAHTFIVHGGRDTTGSLRDDALIVDCSDDGEIEATVVNAFISAAPAKCCHQLMALGGPVVLSCGGFGTERPQLDALHVISADPPISVRSIPIPSVAVDGGVQNFGFGHSVASWEEELVMQDVPPRRTLRRHIVVGGLTPDKASGSLCVFELVVSSAR